MLMMLCAMVVIVVPASSARAPAVVHLARAIEGEGAGFFEDRDEAGTWIAHAAMNRVSCPWWPDTLEGVVRDGFHGHVRVMRPADWALALAREAMSREEDLAQGAFFVLSGQDLDAHGWRGEGAVRAFEDGGYALYFFREWPG